MDKSKIKKVKEIHFLWWTMGSENAFLVDFSIFHQRKAKGLWTAWEFMGADKTTENVSPYSREIFWTLSETIIIIIIIIIDDIKIKQKSK